MDDDTLEKSGEPFGAKYGETGFGTSEVMQELMSRDPKYLRVKDLQGYQQGLVDTGYLPPTYEPTGNWDDLSAAADRRASRDAFNTARSGGSFLAASTQTLFRYLGYTVPTSVFEGMYGIAKGIVDDAVRAASNPVEVAQEGGLLGGAAVGAGIGATAGLIGGPLAPVTSGVGAIVGGAIGGVAGFFGDLFDDDEDEDGDWNRIVGALSPLDEIRSGDAKNLFAALSTVMTASAILKAGSVAAQGVRAVGTVTGSRAAGGMVLPEVTGGIRTLGLREGYRMAARDAVSPGLANQFTQAALKHRVVGSAAVGGLANATPELVQGDFGQAMKDFGTGALWGAALGPVVHRLPGAKNAVGKVLKGLDAAPLARVVGSPVGKVTQALYTGATTPTIVSRAIGEMADSSGGTGISRATEQAPDLGTAGTVLDFTLGAVVFPERLLPWRARDVSKAVTAMGSNHALLPFAEHARRLNDGTVLSMQKGMERARELMGRGTAGEMDPVALGVRVHDSYLQYGIELEAEQRVASRVAEFKSTDAFSRMAKEFDIEDALAQERSKIKSTILSQVGDTQDVVGKSTLASNLVEKAMTNQTGMRNFLSQKGFDFEFWAQHQRATEFLNANGPVKEGVRFTPAVKGEYLTAQDFERFGGTADELGEYEVRAQAARRAYNDLQSADAPTEQLQDALAIAGKALDDTLLEMKTRGIVTDEIYHALRPQGGEPLVERKLINYLQSTAKKRPREVEELSGRLSQQGLDRYIAVATGENMIDYSNFLRQAEIEGLTEYTRRQGFWDSLSSLGAKVDKADIGKLRYNSIVSHLDSTADDLLVGHDGKSVANALYDELRLRYDVKYAERRGEKLEVQLGSFIRREDLATGKVKRELFKVDPRDLTADDIVSALKLEEPGVLREGLDAYEAADRIKRSLHVGAAFGADVAHPLHTARALGASLKTVGLPGFNDFMRTINFVPTKLASKLPEKFKKGSYGYLPQHLRRAHMAVQFSLSPTFDASRYMEAVAFGKFRGGDIPIKAATSPKKFVHDYEEGWVSPESGQRIFKKEASDEMVRFGDRVLYGRAANQNFDELQLRLLHRGVLGFKPREVEYAQAWWLAQKKLKRGALTQADLEEIRETVMQIGQYGTKQTAFGNTAHFIFFPYLFSQKQLSAMVDFTLGAPTRNLLVHEGLRRWYSVTGDDGTSMSEDFAQYMQKHIPIAEELQRINNLAYGISPGRFFLEGLLDKRTEGKVAQGLASFLLPGGVHQPIADTLGAGTEALKNLFVPVVLVDDGTTTGSTSQVAPALLERLIPAYRDLDRWFFDTERHGADYGIVGAQITALSGRGTPRAQMSEYLDVKRVMGQSLDAMAVASGYASWDSLASSQPEIAQVVNDIDLDLGNRFPQGKQLANEFTNTTELKEQALYDIAQKPDQTRAEEAVTVIADIEARAKALAGETGLTQEEVLRAYSPIIREFALTYVRDRQFMNLWDGLGFRTSYGPLRQIEVA